MDKLWAPWRMQYIEHCDDDKDRCIFCEPEENMKIASEKGFVLVMNKYPYNNGHIMAAPVRHGVMLDDMDKEELAELMTGVQRGVSILKKVYNPDGINVGINMGRTAGAGITEHLHVHIVPRWNGDTNFMPVIAETKIISQSLEESLQRLRKAYTELYNE